MRKLALLVAAAFLVSAPMLATTPTETFAAAAKKSKGKSEDPTAANTGLFRALGDQMAGGGKADKGKDKGMGMGMGMGKGMGMGMGRGMGMGKKGMGMGMGKKGMGMGKSKGMGMGMGMGMGK